MKAVILNFIMQPSVMPFLLPFSILKEHSLELIITFPFL